MEKDDIYVCDICGNEVKIMKIGGGTLYCCGRDMEKVGDKDKL